MGRWGERRVRKASRLTSRSDRRTRFADHAAADQDERIVAHNDIVLVVTALEQKRSLHPAKEAIAGDCGIIVAAALASLFSGRILDMKEFGLALTAGILIDTFPMCPSIVPSAVLRVDERRAAFEAAEALAPS